MFEVAGAYFPLAKNPAKCKSYTSSSDCNGKICSGPIPHVGTGHYNICCPNFQYGCCQVPFPTPEVQCCNVNG